MATTEYRVTGMTCGHCEMSVREEVGEVAGVTGVEASHVTGVLRVEGAAEESDVLDAVAEAGYSAARS